MLDGPMPSKPAAKSAAGATAAGSISPNRRLADCESWPTSHTLPSAVRARLDFLTFRLRARNRPARPEDTLAVLVVCFAPANPATLLALIRKTNRGIGGTVAQLPTGRYRGRLRQHNEQVMLRLPGPVTLRVNALVDGIHDLGVRTSRRQVVSAIVLHCAPASVAKLVTEFDRLPNMPARAAAVTGRPLVDVLRTTRPAPGRRPMP
jgi:hypothetical protein